MLLAPAITVMNRLKYPQKFALISLLFALPLALLGGRGRNHDDLVEKHS